MDDMQLEDGFGRIYTAMEAQMNIRAQPLDRAITKAGRRLPWPARKAGQRLAAIEPLCAHPKLRRQIDTARAQKDMAVLLRALEGYDRRARRIHALLGWATANMVNLFVMFAILIALLRWRGVL